jgi:hypothetical protein
MLKLISLLFILNFAFRLASQPNLIPNPGFEECQKCDPFSGTKELTINVGANDPIDWTGATYGTPDIRPTSPHMGKRHGGFFVGFPKFEYLLNHFTECLKPGAKYQFSFWVRPSTQNPVYIIDEIGVYIEKGPGIYPQAEPLKQLTPTYQSADGDFINQSGYRQLSFEYTAQGGEINFIVGRFRALGANDTVFVGTKRPANPSGEPIYYFVDDFEMKEIAPGIVIDLIPDEIVLCPGEKKQLSIPAPYNQGNITWSTGEKTAIINVPESDSVSVEIILNDTCKTTIRDITKIRIEKNIPPVITGPDEICKGDAITLKATCDSCTELSWTTLVVTEPGAYIVTANSKCGVISDTHIVSSYIEDYPIKIEGEDKICKGQKIKLSVSCGPCISFHWNTNDKTREIEIKEPGIYYVDTKSKCSSKSTSKEIKSLNIELDSLMQFPNVIIPHGEMVNRNFGPVFNETKRDSVLSMKLLVLNRWGQNVFESTDKDTKWTPDDDDPMDTYMYVCEIEYKDCDGIKKTSLKGTVTLVR